MTAATAVADLPAVPLTVLDFTEARNATRLLRPVTEAARAAFPDVPLRLYLEANPELADEKRVIVEVDVTGWSAEAMNDAYDQWVREVFQTCGPGQVVSVFQLRMTETP